MEIQISWKRTIHTEFKAIDEPSLSFEILLTSFEGLFTPSESGSESEKDQTTKKNQQTRMHSSRMHTVRCSDRLVGGNVCLGWGCLPGGVCLGESSQGRCLPRGGLSEGCLPRGCLPRGCTPPPPPWTDRRLWKHYLSATTVINDKHQRKISVSLPLWLGVVNEQ